MSEASGKVTRTSQSKTTATKPTPAIPTVAAPNRITLKDYALGKDRNLLHMLAAEYGDPRLVSKTKVQWDVAVARIMSLPAQHSPIV